MTENLDGSTEDWSRWNSVRLHPEDPITEDTFQELASIVATINEKLNITGVERNKTYAFSEGEKGEPSLTVEVYGDNLNIASTHNEHGENIYIRVTAQIFRDTDATPDLTQPVASATILWGWPSPGQILHREDLSNQSLLELTKYIAGRQQMGSFVKRERIRRFYSRVA